MSKILKIGIIGCGAIGSSLARAIKADFAKQARLIALFDLEQARARRLAQAIGGCAVCKDAMELIEKSDLVVEAAAKKSSFEIARAALSAGKDVLLMSVGGIADKYAALARIARKRKAKLYIPSGALCGVDGLKASSCAGLKQVTLTTSKNPRSFKGVEYLEKKGLKLETIKQTTLLFSGSARQAVNFFPQNINVAAILSLAGLGADKTRIRIIAAPGLKNNVHELEIVSCAGRIRTRTENVLHPDNPKTSFLAVLSAIAVLKQIVEPIKIGT
jgi:aspartate dehydrogenase